MQLLIAVNCSARKTASPAPNLRARTLSRGTPADLADEWRARCSENAQRIAAGSLYAGRGFSLAYRVARSAGAELRVISAGMGLLRPETTIPPYSLTLSQSAADCIFRRASPRDTFTPDAWWEAIRARSKSTRPFARLLSIYPKSLLLLAVSSPYLAMIAGELKTLAEGDRDRIRLVGPTRVQLLPEELRPNALPYDARLNDVGATLRGTAFDFPSRALGHFVELIRHDKRVGDCASHARRVRQSLAYLTAPEHHRRKRVDDITLQRKIRALKAQNFSRTAGLRHLRGELALACEQERFAIAWGHR